MEGTRIEVAAAGQPAGAGAHRGLGGAGRGVRGVPAARPGWASGEAPLSGGGSDASVTGAAGVPSIDGLGPRGAGFHTHDEYIELGSLVPKAEALVRFLHGRMRR